MHHTRAHLLLSLALLVGGSLAAGCNPNSIGRLCVNPQNTAPLGTSIVSPALECPSRLCLITPTTDPAFSNTGRTTCTAQCGSNSDCQAESKEACASGFACAVATTVGSFCCEKVCICRDDLIADVNKDRATPYNIITPPACEPSTPDAPNPSTCPNIKK